MRQPHHRTMASCRLTWSSAFGLLVAFALLFVAPASANYEKVSNFASGPEGLLEGANGIAVNSTGAGGVPVGTVYAVTRHQQFSARVFRYNAEGVFREAWGWRAGSSSEEFQRCGPEGEAAHPTCSDPGSGLTGSGEGLGQLWNPQGVAVDQATGNVYVYNFGRKKDAVQIFSAQGVPIGGFGENVRETETVEDSPEKFHIAEGPNGNLRNHFAVDDAGNVYIADYSQQDGHQSVRVMVFKPQSPGDYEHYVYAGRANDIASSTDVFNGIRSIALDEAGNLYTASSEFIREYSLTEPSAPICQFKVPGGQLEAMTVNAKRGEVFYYRFGKIHQLSGCDTKTGEFTEKGSFSVGGTAVLAFDPALSVGESRPVGILYYAEGKDPGSINEIFAPAKAISPTVESESVPSVGSTSAVLHAQVNPRGSQTRYVFQYLTQAAYEANGDSFEGASEAPLGGALLGNGQEVLGAGVSLAGLEADTGYVFRAIATSFCNPEEEETPCEAVGAAGSFHTFPAEAPGLPDGRAYELVSPDLKGGGEVFPLEPERYSCSFECKPNETVAFPKQSSPDGEAIVYEGSPFSNNGAAVRENEYVARRTASGWQTTNLSPELLKPKNGPRSGFKAFNAELTKEVIYQDAPSLSPDGPSETPNLYAQETADPTALSPLLGAGPPNRFPGELKLKFAGASGDFSQLFFEANDALTGEAPFTPEAVDGGKEKKNLYESAGGSLRLVNVLPGNAETVPGATFGWGSSDAEAFRQFDFDHVISADGSRVFWSSEAGQVYVRENGEATKEIPDHVGKFLTASADGSKLLLNNGQLYDVDDLGEAPLDLTEGKGGFQGIAGQSEDLSSVYFVDTAVLDGGENERHQVPQGSADNLYLRQGGVTRFITTLDSGDNSFTGWLPGEIGDWHAAGAFRSAEASPAGRYLAFMSRGRLTGADNVGPCGSAKANGPCEEIFLYDSATGRLSCASCSPTGLPPLGSSRLPLIKTISSDYQHQPRYLTDSGRLYFDSRDSLSVFDTNEGVEDVYQYEPEGQGSCKREAGCVNLVSAGSEPVDSNFFAADESGKNVFFTTRDRLALKDRDDLIDIYDARVDGGIASETETSRGECQGEACQASFFPPNDPTPGSSTFEGAGNVNEAKAKKHKKKHAKKHKSHKTPKRSHGRAANNNRGGAK